jgi:protein-tyrosine-phosphatase
MLTVLFVCSGNLCRSPIAEGLLRHKLPASMRQAVRVESAGTLGLKGRPATPLAVEAARELGADIAGHRSQAVAPELVERADLILALAAEHRDYLRERFPNQRPKVFLLKRYAARGPRSRRADSSDSIADPIGGDLDTYRVCATLINAEIERILPALLRRARSKRPAVGHR